MGILPNVQCTLDFEVRVTTKPNTVRST